MQIIRIIQEDNPSQPPLSLRGGEYFPLKVRGIEGVISPLLG
jgi:hypothetical protein